MKPLAVDLCCGLGGWTEGLLAEDWDVVGFDIEQHVYGAHRYPAQLVLQDILTLDGRQFRGKVSLIVASPPCQKFSYMAMPWTRAKALAVWYRDPEHPERLVELTALFDACVRIGREAECPIVIENVRGAQSWVGRSKWNYGSYHLFGDVPALMPIAQRAIKVATMGAGWYPPDHPKHVKGLGFNTHADRATKNSGGSWFAVAHNTTSGHGQNPDGRQTTAHDAASRIPDEDTGIKQHGSGRDWFAGPGAISAVSTHGSPARKAASARIAKIPFRLASYIAQVYRNAERAA